jgi:pyrroloquinoline quinone biosynthesis protein E
MVSKQLFPYLVEVQPTDIGEPLMSEWFEYFCDKVAEYGVLLDITTNGMLLDESKVYKILHNLLDIKISFDGIKKETFERIRKGSNYDTVIKNIDNLLKIRNKEKSLGTVTLQMTLLNFNYTELPEVIKLAHEKGADGVKAYPAFSYSNEINKLSLFNEWEQFEEIRIISIDLANELNIKLEITEPDNGTTQDLIFQKCRFPWSECRIDSDGEVYPCHSHNHISYGNVNSTNFQSVWNSNHAKELRMPHINTGVKTICENCGMNYIRQNENQAVPYDKSGFLHNFNDVAGSVKWSSRSKQFLLGR